MHSKEYAASMTLMKMMTSQFSTCSVTKSDMSYGRRIDIKQPTVRTVALLGLYVSQAVCNILKSFEIPADVRGVSRCWEFWSPGP